MKRLTSEIQLYSYKPRHYCIVLVKVYEQTKVHDLKDEEIKNKWQEYTDEVYEKVLMTQITMIVWPLT